MSYTGNGGQSFYARTPKPASYSRGKTVPSKTKKTKGSGKAPFAK